MGLLSLETGRKRLMISDLTAFLAVLEELTCVAK
jgi:hypothetical protein